jgi:hypothetical protein
MMLSRAVENNRAPDTSEENYQVLISGDLAAEAKRAGRTGDLASVERKAKAPVMVKISDRRHLVEPLTPKAVAAAAAKMFAAVAAALFAIVFIRRSIAKSRMRTPYDIAIGELKAIASGLRKGTIPPSEFCSRVPPVIKGYGKALLNKETSELTTREFLDALAAAKTVSGEAGAEAGRLLSFCDLVKYTGREPTADEIKEYLSAAEKLAADMRPAAEAGNAGDR